MAFPCALPFHCSSHKFDKHLSEVMQCAPLLTQVERVKSFIIVSLVGLLLVLPLSIGIFSYYKIFLKAN